ncbi:MAG: iron-sulfur cluster assembly scaffold protein [Candidatus Aenigmarchaeota archaeon]|nr:iron-sulfur cluster assembly scaffold protein [Candidatus Aenigmarchaeota archaeon]
MNGPYPKEIMEHFKNPKNIGTIKDADGIGKVGNLVCGDVMMFYIKVDKNKISDIKFQTFGCVVAIAVSSMLTEMVKGKTLNYAIKTTSKDILKKSGKVPTIKAHCSVLAADALHEAIYDYMLKQKMKIPAGLEKEHKRIKKNLENTEKKHKTTKLEEELLNNF